VRIRSALVTLVSMALIASQCRGSGGEPAPLRTPLLETVVLGRRLIPQDPDGHYRVLPVQGQWLGLRLQGDAHPIVWVDATKLERRRPGEPQDGWFDFTADAPPSGSRLLFYDVVVRLPAVLTSNCSSVISIFYESDRPAPKPLRVQLSARRGVQGCPDPPPLASDVFDDTKEGSKGHGTTIRNWAEHSIVARGIVVAGWLASDPVLNPGSAGAEDEDEDFHWDLWLDHDFIVRNYGKMPLDPITGATIPGHGRQEISPGTPISFAGSDSIGAHWFNTMTTAQLWTELNAYHERTRGPRPAGWVADPTGRKNAWPFDPYHPIDVPPGEQLKAGDYVIVSGTLWEDSGHLHCDRGDVACATDPVHQFAECVEGVFPGHEGWLEIHPVDSIRRAESPFPRRHVEARSVCNPERSAINEFIPPLPPPPEYGDRAELKFQALVDTRFTSSNASHSEKIEPDCVTALHVTLLAGQGGTARVVYILWWDRADGSRPQHCQRAVVQRRCAEIRGTIDDHERSIAILKDEIDGLDLQNPADKQAWEEGVDQLQRLGNEVQALKQEAVTLACP
jgi:hypothetical protein